MEDLFYFAYLLEGKFTYMLELKPKSDRNILLLIGIIIIAVNLRPGMTSVGPLLGIIRDDLQLANWSVALLTSLPLLAFAFISPLVPRLGRSLSNERAMILGLLLLMLGIFIRSTTLIILLFTGTILVGLGIAICNVLLPGVVKENFPLKVGLMTSVYSTTMGIFAAISSGLSVPFASGLNWGWERSLAFWMLPALLGVLIWGFLSRENKGANDVEMRYVSSDNFKIWRSPLAWQVALYMGLQSTVFYVSVSWLPEIFHSNGIDLSKAGWLLSYTQLIGMPVSFIVPVLAGRMRSQQVIVLLLGLFSMTGLAGLLFFGQNYILLLISTTFLGISLGGTFALALTYLGIRAKNAEDAAELSGMAQSVGYTCAALGPVLIGLIFDLTNNWTFPLVVLLIISSLVILFGLGAGRDRVVFQE